MAEFHWPVRVYYEDTDSGGVVYYANYLRFLERARSEWLRWRGVEQDQLMAATGLGFVVRKIDLHYRRPARFNDLLTVRTRIASPGRASLVFHQAIWRGSILLCDGRVQVACVDLANLQPRPLPSALREKVGDV